MKVRDVIKRLEDDGWRLARTNGSIGSIIIRPSRDGYVAGRPSVDIPSGTLNNILKQAGLK